MNHQAPFQLSEESKRTDAAKAAKAAQPASTKRALKARSGSLAAQAMLTDFVCGELNEEEQRWADEDEELAKYFKMCSQKEIERMREERARAAA